MATIDIKNSDIPLWAGANGTLAVTLQGDPTRPPQPSATPIGTATFQVDGNRDIALRPAGSVGIGVKAGMNARLVAIFRENQGAGADLVTRYGLGDALASNNVLLGFELGGDAAVNAAGGFSYAPLSVTTTLDAGVDASYVAIRAFPRTMALGVMVPRLIGDLELPGGVDSPPGAGEVYSFEFGGSLAFSVGASAGYDLKGTGSFRISEIALSETYALAVVGKLVLSGSVSGRFSVDVTAGSKPGFARVVVRRRRTKELQIAADVNASASLTTQGLPASGKEFLGALLGLRAQNWLNLADTLVTEAGRVDSIATLETKLDGLATNYLDAYAGKAIAELTSVPEIKAFQSRLATVVDSYRNLDKHAIALFDRYFDPVLDRVGELTAKLDELNALTSWDRLKGEIDPTLWNVVRQLTDGDPLGWILGTVPGTDIPSLPKLKARIDSALSLVRDSAHDEIRKFITVGKQHFGLDGFMNQLGTISTEQGLRSLANEQLGHFVERLIGQTIDSLNGNALKKALDAVKAVAARRETFFASFDTILKEAASQKFTFALHAAYNSSTERDALIDLEIKLEDAPGVPNAIGRRYMQAMGRGDFQDVLANYQPDVVTLRQGVLSHTASRTTALSFNIAGWHRAFTYASMHRVIVGTEQQIRDSGNGLLSVFTTVDMTASSERRRRGSKGEETVLTNFMLRLLGETKVNDSSFDDRTEQYVVDIVTGMTAAYSVTFTDEDTTPEELDDYLRFAATLGLDRAGATRAGLAPFLQLKGGSFGKTSSVYDVRYTQAGMRALLASRPSPADVKQILRRIVLANYFNVPALHDVGWLYGSDAVRDLFDEQGVNLVNAESILGSARVELSSPIAGLLPPSTFANTRPIREVLFSLFQIEDDVLAAFGDLKKVLASTKKISTAELEKRLASFGLAIDAFDKLDGLGGGENSIFAVMDGLIQLGTPADEARASSLTFTSDADGATRTKVFTIGAAG